MLSFLANLPFKYHWFLVVLMGIVIPLATAKTNKPGEFYPFSNFPMYSRFGPDTYYVYVKDAQDAPVPFSIVFGRSITDLKKHYDDQLAAEKTKAKIKGVDKVDLPEPLKRAAAVQSLQWLVRITPLPKHDELRKCKAIVLHEVQVVFADGKIQESDTKVGELDVQDTP